METHWESNAEYWVENGNLIETNRLPNPEILGERLSSDSQILYYRNGCSPTCYPEQENYFTPGSLLLPSPSDSELSQDGFEPFCYSDLGPAGWEPKKSMELLNPKVDRDYRSSASSPSSSSTSSCLRLDTSVDQLQKDAPHPKHDDQIWDAANGPLLGPEDQLRLRKMEKTSTKLSGNRLVTHRECNLTKKKRHSAIEKRYRTTLNDRISSLHDMIPCLRDSKFQDTKAQFDCKGSSKCPKVTKEAIISGAIEYIQHLEQHHGQLIHEYEVLRASLANFGDFTCTN